MGCINLEFCSSQEKKKTTASNNTKKKKREEDIVYRAMLESSLTCNRTMIISSSISHVLVLSMICACMSLGWLESNVGT